jgi:hypothetical protein
MKPIKQSSTFLSLSIIILLNIISSCSSQKRIANINENISFTEATSDILPLENRSRRKWDNAIIADLDQDGLQDMILIEHSWQVQIYWNNGGKFSKPYVLTKGDLHGVAIADYDFDGKINLIVVQGGGGGSTPRNPLLYQVNKDRTIESADQIPDLEKMRGRSAKLIDADSNGDLDLLITGFPTPEQLKQGANHMHKNYGKGDFTFLNILPKADRLSYKTSVTDYNNDGISDIIFYGGDHLVAVKGETGINYSKANTDVLKDISKTKEVSSITEIDFDNDGDFDLFLTRAQHSFKGETFFDAENKRFAFFARFKPFKYEDLKIDGDFKLENLQMAYPHFDVFVGKNKRKLKFKGDNHGHKDFTLTQKEADGFPLEMKKKGLYIGYVGHGFWRIAGDTKSPTAGVVLNVISTPNAAAIEEMPALLLENKDGRFIDVTQKMGISIPEQTTGATVGDFNNDGWSDLFVVRYGVPASENKQILLKNNNGNSFTSTKNHHIISKELGATGGQAETIDYDADGDLDIIYANERGRWHLFTNDNNNDNNFLNIKVGSSPNKGTSAQGAILTIKSCGNIYKRIVGATSSSYSQGLNINLHIGLGKCTKIDDAKIRWTNGEEKSFYVKDLNTSIFVGKK